MSDEPTRVERPLPPLEPEGAVVDLDAFRAWWRRVMERIAEHYDA